MTLDVPVQTLAFYDTDSRAWQVEPMMYTVSVGPSSSDLPLSASFAVRGG